jgi:hypothetical protein
VVVDWAGLSFPLGVESFVDDDGWIVFLSNSRSKSFRASAS